MMNSTPFYISPFYLISLTYLKVILTSIVFNSKIRVVCGSSLLHCVCILVIAFKRIFEIEVIFYF